MYQLSPNIELLFSEAGPDPAARVRAAAAAGFDAVEMWGTLDKDVNALAKALSDSGVALTSVLAEPRTNFTLPGTDLGPFFDGLARGVENARLLGAPRIVLGSGVGFPGGQAGEEPGTAGRGLLPGRRANPGLGREAHPRAGQYPGRPSRRAPRPDGRRRHRRQGSQLRLVRHPVRPLPLRHRGRGPGDRASQRWGRPGLRADRRLAGPGPAGQRRDRLAGQPGRAAGGGLRRADRARVLPHHRVRRIPAGHQASAAAA